MKIAIYPGTFDPITKGHIDIIEKAANIFDKLVVVIGVNSLKMKTLFNQNERINMINFSIKHLNNVSTLLNNDLTINIAKKLNACAIIRGIRAVSDFDYEFQIALANRKMSNEIDTIFMLPDEKYIYISSSIVKEIASYNEEVSAFVNEYVAEKLREKFEINKIETI